LQDADLVFDEKETKGILCFFWPHESVAIDRLAITNDVRRYAQGLLIV